MSGPIELNSDTCMYWCGCLVKDGPGIYKLIDVEEEEGYDSFEEEYYTIYRPIGVNRKGSSAVLSEDIKPYLPKLGYRQVGKTVAFYSRVKRTQYKKGIHMDYLNIFCPQKKELEAVEKWELIGSFNNIFNVVEQEYTPLEEAIKMLQDRSKWAVALHNWWAIVLKVGHDNPLLYYKRMPVGEVIGEEIKFFEGQSERKFWMEIRHET